MQIETLRVQTSARLAIISIDTTLRTAACALSNPHIGLVVACDETGRAAGVVSKSDIVRHLANEGATESRVANLMSRNIVSCAPEDDLCSTWQRMAALNLQNVPVLNTDSVPLGVLDIRDALKVLYEQEEYQEQLLLNYIGGVGYQ
jgi:CBS domain-containing protein